VRLGVTSTAGSHLADPWASTMSPRYCLEVARRSLTRSAALQWWADQNILFIGIHTL